MHDDPDKVCPECGGEYQSTVDVCIDCGVPLVLPEAIAERDARELRLRPGLVYVRTAPILWIRDLAADLAQANVPYAIDRHAARDEGLLSLFVQRKGWKATVPLDAARRRIDPLEADDEPEEDAPEADEPEESEPADYKVCPECGGEFRLEIVRCPDCDVDLVAPGEEEEPAEEDAPSRRDFLEDIELENPPAFPNPPRHEIPASDDLVCLGCAWFDVLADLSAALDDAGIGHCIERGPHERSSQRACIYLRPEDCEAAEPIWNGPQGVGGDSADERTCPACGTSVPPNASACPGCRLGSQSPSYSWTCSHCGALQIGLLYCPNCGGSPQEP